LSVIYRDGHGTPQERVLYRLTSRDCACRRHTASGGFDADPVRARPPARQHRERVSRP
jgi:hypothetical protein